MKVVGHLSLIGVAVGLLFAAVSSVSAEDVYVATELLDPLQPVWDAVDRIPDTVVRAIKTQLSMMNRQMDNKMESLTQKMTALLQSHYRVEQSVNSRGNGVNDHINDHMTNLQQQFYETHYRADLAAAVAKIELHVNTQFDALEAKLERHINTKFASLSVSLDTDEDRGNTDDVLSSLYQSVRRNTVTLGTINTHVLKINENLAGSSEGGDGSCSTLVDKVAELMQTVSSAAGKVCPSVNQVVCVCMCNSSSSGSSSSNG